MGGKHIATLKNSPNYIKIMGECGKYYLSNHDNSTAVLKKKFPELKAFHIQEAIHEAIEKAYKKESVVKFVEPIPESWSIEVELLKELL